MPYRGGPDEREVDKAHDGLVVEMVRQFADPHAFGRELIQNAIDAGASHVVVQGDHAGGVGAISVRDDGRGMTRDVIEGPLLTLFGSAKTSSDAIGKYGVGFVSVFAIDPDEVAVQTWSGAQSWQLTIGRDHSYELAVGPPSAEAGGAASARGTVVTLRRNMNLAEFQRHRERLLASLRRWCRHACVPIRAVFRQEGVVSFDGRIDTPLSVPCATSVAEVGEGMHIVVGPAPHPPPVMHGHCPDGAPFAGFYNRGLMLHETRRRFSEALDGLCFKVDSPDLTHTISRDNVRRDEAFERALERVANLRGRLRVDVLRRLEAVSARAARGELVHDLLQSLLDAACTTTLDIDVAEVCVPVCHPRRDEVVVPLGELVHDDTLVYDDAPNELTARLAERGIGVMRAPVSMQTIKRLSMLLEVPFLCARAAFTHLQPVQDLSQGDAKLLDRVGWLLRKAGERATSVVFALPTGAPFSPTCWRADNATEPALVAAHAQRPFTFLFHDPVWMLSTGHVAVRAARELAVLEPLAAADLLARCVLIDNRGTLSKRVNDRLLDARGQLR